MNFIPFFFLGYVLGQNRRKECDSDEINLVTLETLEVVCFTLCVGTIAAFGSFLAMPTRASIDAPHLSMHLEVLSVFIPAIIVFCSGLTYMFWQDRAGEISQRAVTLTLATAAALTLAALCLRLFGISTGFSPVQWLIARHLPAMLIPVLLVIFDSLSKWRSQKPSKSVSRSQTPGTKS